MTTSLITCIVMPREIQHKTLGPVLAHDLASAAIVPEKRVVPNWGRNATPDLLPNMHVHVPNRGELQGTRWLKWPTRLSGPLPEVAY